MTWFGYLLKDGPAQCANNTVQYVEPEEDHILVPTLPAQLLNFENMYF